MTEQYYHLDFGYTDEAGNNHDLICQVTHVKSPESILHKTIGFVTNNQEEATNLVIALNRAIPHERPFLKYIPQASN